MLDHLRADRAHIEDLQARILHLESCILGLRLEQSQVQERVDSYKYYPVLTLPNELVSDIFLHTLPPYPQRPQLIGPFSPTVLTQICRSWRDVALGTPRLWSVINLNGDDPYPLTAEDSGTHIGAVQAQRRSHTFKLWLQRSNSCPLSIDFGIRSRADFGAALPHHARFEHLKIKIFSEDFRMFDSPMPLLQHLDLSIDDGKPMNASRSRVIIRDVPLLRTVILNDFASRVVLPWAQLTSLTLIFPLDFVPILVEATSLVHCTLLFHINRGDNGGPRPDIPLPCLESLDLHVIQHDGPAADFLSTFIVPALRSLRITERFLAPSPLDSLSAFISRSNCKLEELCLTSRRLLPKKAYRHAFPSLRKLCFEFESGMADNREDSDSSGS
ncbi:hypothetical protein DFH06DRAFT_1480326 [Mycena polygramma]|nr:hypothetical protein DFH06DRAFT_1480326 [Mycena polygramma]